MKTIIALIFCFLLGASIQGQGWTALLWFPAGFVFGLFATAQMLLPLVLGLPIAIRLVVKGQMRPAVFGAIIRTPVIWFVQLFAVGYFWPAAAVYVYNNLALNLGGNVGMIAIVLSPLSKKYRSNFRQDFDNAYQRFYTEAVQTEEKHKNINYNIFQCQDCGQKLRIPIKNKLLKITCPSCKNTFHFQNGEKA